MPLLLLYNVKDRVRVFPALTFKALLRIARNLAISLHALHHAGYVVGDLNESNILVARSNTFVTLIDCDSMQVHDPRTHRLSNTMV